MINTPEKHQPHILIAGGGITGLSAAWEIQQLAPDCRVTVLEGGERWGGKVQTHVIPSLNGADAFIADAGPESFVTRKPEAWDLAQELGLGGEIHDPGSETRGIFVLDEGRIHPVPLGPGAFITSRLLSFRGKLRLLAEPLIPPKQDNEDESLADFASRRLGKEATDKFIGPILGGIYNANPERQSILTTSPVMRRMEKESGSLVKALIGRMRAARKNVGSKGPKRPRFIGFKDGAGRMVAALVSQLEADLRLNAQVGKVTDGEGGFRVELVSGETISADAVLLATPANATAEILAESYPQLAGKLGRIRHENAGTIALTYRAADLPAGRTMIGLMIPRREGRRIDAVQWTSTKMPERAPEGYALLRVFFGGGSPATVEMNDGELLSVIKSELRTLLGINAEPLKTAISRWPNGFPQADVGHLDRVAEIESALPDGLALAGSSYRGIAVPDCIRQGRAAARTLVAFVQQIENAQSVPAEPAGLNVKKNLNKNLFQEENN